MKHTYIYIDYINFVNTNGLGLEWNVSGSMSFHRSTDIMDRMVIKGLTQWEMFILGRWFIQYDSADNFVCIIQANQFI